MSNGTDADVAKLWRAYRRRRTAANRNRLIVAVLPMARGIATQVAHRTGLESGELLGEAVLVAMRGLPRWRRGGGRKLTTWLYEAMRWGAWRAAKQLRRRAASLDAAMDAGDEAVRARATLADPSAGRAIRRLEDAEAAGRLLGVLGPELRAVAVWHFGEGRSLVEIGRLLGVTDVTAARRAREALALLRREARRLGLTNGTRHPHRRTRWPDARARD